MLEETPNSITQDELNSYRIGSISCHTKQLSFSGFKPCKGCWYLEDIKAYVYISNYTIYIKDLVHAMRRGLECSIYQLSVRYNYRLKNHRDEVPVSERPIDLLVWIEEQHIPTITALYQIMRKPFTMEGVAYLTYADSAYTTYSPFAIVKPIQTPQKWTRAHIWKAIFSGQIYRGKINYIYTDDYLQDALRNCCEDVELSAEDLMGKANGLLTGNWRCSVIATEHQDGTVEINLWDCNSSYILYYDPKRHC